MLLLIVPGPWVVLFMTLILFVSNAEVSAAQVRGVMSVQIGALTSFWPLLVPGWAPPQT